MKRKCDKQARRPQQVAVFSPRLLSVFCISKKNQPKTYPKGLFKQSAVALVIDKKNEIFNDKKILKYKGKNMYAVLISSFITLTTFLLDIYGKCQKPLYKYIMLFFLIAGISFFFKAMKAEATDFSQYYERLMRAESPRFNFKFIGKEKSKQQIQKDFIEDCWKKANYHYEEGCKYLKEAEDVSLLFPDLHDFDKAQFCLLNAVAVVAPGEPTLRLIAAALAIGGQYASMLMEEWQKFKMLLLQSKTHFEMEEHYRMMGKYHYDMYFAEKAENEKKQKSK